MKCLDLCLAELNLDLSRSWRELESLALCTWPFKLVSLLRLSKSLVLISDGALAISSLLRITLPLQSLLPELQRSSHGRGKLSRNTGNWLLRLLTSLVTKDRTFLLTVVVRLQWWSWKVPNGRRSMKKLKNFLIPRCTQLKMKRIFTSSWREPSLKTLKDGEESWRILLVFQKKPPLVSTVFPSLLRKENFFSLPLTLMTLLPSLS